MSCLHTGIKDALSLWTGRVVLSIEGMLGLWISISAVYSLCNKPGWWWRQEIKYKLCTQAISLTELYLLLEKCPCLQPVWVEKKLFHSFWSFSFLFMSLSPKKKKNKHNFSGIFKTELEPASHQKQSCHPWEKAQREAVWGGMASVPSSNNASTWVSLAKEHSSRNSPLLQQIKIKFAEQFGC